MRKRLCALLSLTVLGAVAFCPVALAQMQPASVDDLSALSIDQLVNLEVTSPSKKREKISDVASAIYVITKEDIRRSGATTLMDAFRMVPGLDVARIDNSQWAISARGFNGVYGDKLLVLMDGRSIYTPLFGGVFWNEHDYLLEDIERIEVIRGPGATLYGANAVNGVINIITSSSKDTKGNLVTGGGGSQERAFGAVRHGGESGALNYRVYAKYFDREENELAAGGDAHDDWRGARTGFRSDTDLTGRDELTVQGDFFYGESGWDYIIPNLATYEALGDTTRYHSGGNLLSRWTRNLADDSSLQLQMYYDRIDRNDKVLEQQRDTIDLDFQYRYKPLERHDIITGFGYRLHHDDDMEGTFSVSLDPPSRTIDMYQWFAQDEITLVDNMLRFIAGVKLETNELSGPEVLPSAKLITTPDEDNSIWASVSRATRSPTRFNHDGRLVLAAMPSDQGVPTVVTLSGDSGYDSEELIAYELGYRAALLDTLSMDLALFYNDYDSLESAEPAGDPFLNSFDGQPYIEVPYIVENKLEGETYGGEVTFDWGATKWWRLVSSYALLQMDLRRTGGSVDEIFMAGENQSPEHQIIFRSLMNLPHNMEFDSMLRYVSEISTFDIDSYWALDLRLGWHVTRQLELSLVGQNLLEDSHAEFESNLVDTQRTDLVRGGYAKATWRF